MSEQVRTEEVSQGGSQGSGGHTKPLRMHQGLALSTALPGTMERFSREPQLNTPLQITARVVRAPWGAHEGRSTKMSLNPHHIGLSLDIKWSSLKRGMGAMSSPFLAPRGCACF